MHVPTPGIPIGHTPLHNDHNVYILGAGFSASSGMPVVRGFLNEMRLTLEWLEEQPDREVEFLAVSEVLGFLQKAAAAGYRAVFDAENIEELFSLASASADKGIANSMVLAICATLDFCQQTYEQPAAAFVTPSDVKLDLPWTPAADQRGVGDGYTRYAPSLSAYQVAALLGRLGPFRAKARNTFISFNYDQVVENAVSQLGMGVAYGLSESALRPMAGLFRSDEDSVPLLKLHGSVNWAESDTAGCLEAHSDYATIRALAKIPVLIPPTWRKDFSRHFDAIWTRAVLALREATRICVIGFSLPETDVHFRYLMCAGLQDNISLRSIKFVDPNIARIKQRIATVLRPELVARGTLELHDQTLEAAVSDDVFLARLGRPRFRGTAPR